MIDRDGILRPDEPDSHAFEISKLKANRYKITDKTYERKNPLYKIMRSFVRGIAVVAFFFIAKIGYGAKAHGKKNYRLAKKTGGVIVCNHVHTFDIAFVASCFSPFKKVWITTIQANMDIPVAGKIVRVLSAIPIPEDIRLMPLFIKHIDNYLKEGEFVSFMPETALWNFYRDLRPFKPSAFRFAAKNVKPVLPVALSFRMKTKTKKDGSAKLNRDGSVKRKYKYTYDYLPPIYPDESLTVPENTERLMQEAHNSMKAAIEKRNAENLEKYGC